MSFSKYSTFDDNLSVTHDFIKQIFKSGGSTPLPPPPSTGLCRGWDRNGSFHPIAAALVMA
jgi:hypothetical protein